MPIFDTSKATSGGGLRSITRFTGTLDDVLEGVKGQYGEQVEFAFKDVTDVESEVEVELDDDAFSFRVKDSSDENSTFMRMWATWEQFALKNKLAKALPVSPEVFMGLVLKMRKKVFENNFSGPDNKKAVVSH